VTVAGINGRPKSGRSTVRTNSATSMDAPDARLNQALEDLSQLVGIQALYEADGSVSALLRRRRW
jgi:hypothetical protein